MGNVYSESYLLVHGESWELGDFGDCWNYNGMVVQLSLTMQQESALKRQVIDVGHINVQEVHIDDG